ncbi:helix-turn-helix domain-containing protein [Kiloniella sp. b19]|uniref:helix-turn-helix domain-containing protein n=1 Tax=Kiloniella sp. GXU_MW_B19 TaxID=3141326 RepID=UPI0031D5EECB
MEKWTGWAKEMLQARDAEISALRDRIDALEERLNRAEDEGKPSLSNAEKRIAITSFLMDPERAKWSDREIARQVGASPQTVANWRQKLDAPAPEGRVVMRGGKLFEMDTRKIGTKGGDTAH